MGSVKALALLETQASIACVKVSTFTAAVNDAGMVNVSSESTIQPLAEDDRPRCSSSSRSLSMPIRQNPDANDESHPISAKKHALGDP